MRSWSNATYLIVFAILIQRGCAGAKQRRCCPQDASGRQFESGIVSKDPGGACSRASWQAEASGPGSHKTASDRPPPADRMKINNVVEDAFAE